MALIDNSTWPLLPTRNTIDRMRHFPSSVYSVNESSILYKYIDALTGDGGAGRLKKELLISRLNQSLDTTFFSDLDRVFGNLGPIIRQVSEMYDIDPSSDLLTTSEWDEVRIKDASYRARIKDFFAALSLGGTPQGLKKMVKAAIGIDSEIYEMWKFQDHFAEIYGIGDIGLYSNYIENPSFEYDTYGWTVSHGGTSSAIAAVASPADAIQDGLQALRFTTGTTVTDPTLTTSSMQVAPSTQYTVSLYYYSPTTTELPTGNFIVVNKNAADSTISTLTSSNQTFAAATRTRISYTFTTPALTDHIVFTFRLNGSITTPTNQFYIDSVLLTGGALQPFFDGNTSGYRWTGVAGQSPSVQASPIDALSRLKVPSRNEIVIYPHKETLSVLERECIREMASRIAPVDSVVTISSSGYAVNVPVSVGAVAADSSYFQINSFVTGTNIVGLTDQEESNTTHRWLQSGVESQAPNPAFLESQEYSQYYVFENSDDSPIDSVAYLKEDILGAQSPEDDYKVIEKSVSAWGQWTTFDVADSPDNYPGGKNGQTPQAAPAINSNGTTYIFPFSSQEDYVNQMKAKITSVEGQVRTYSDLYGINATVDLAYTAYLLGARGEYTDVQYRIPVEATENVLNSWQPYEAIANTPPVRSSTVATGWFSRPLSLAQQF